MVVLIQINEEAPNGVNAEQLIDRLLALVCIIELEGNTYLRSYLMEKVDLLFEQPFATKATEILDAKNEHKFNKLKRVIVGI